MATSSAGVLTLESVESVQDGIEARIRVASPEWMRTIGHPALAEETLSLLPGLARHRCDSGSAHGIVAELADTETPHLVEHIALELLALSGWSRDMRGRTHWDFARDGAGVFRVWIACEDIAAGRTALEGAVLLTAWLLGAEETQPDIKGILVGLAARDV